MKKAERQGKQHPTQESTQNACSGCTTHLLVLMSDE